MLFAGICVVLIALCAGQQHGIHGGICHSNHLQLTEDQAISNVINTLDPDGDGTVETDELVVFFSGLVGVSLFDNYTNEQLDNMTNLELLQLAGNLHIERHEFVNSWHDQFHDSKEFVTALFDTFDTDGNGLWSASEIEGMYTRALTTGDANADGLLERQEFRTFLESLYKTC